MLAFYITLSVSVSFICSMLEAVVLSVSPSYLTSLKGTDPKLYQKIKSLKDDIERPLASILTFNTIAHTIGAAGAGAEAQRIWGNEYLAIFSAVLTFIILFFSEIIPKSIGAKMWKRLLPLSYMVLKPMILISYPIVWFSEKISNLIKGKDEASISRDEIPALAELGLNEGIIHKDEYKTLKSIIKFGNMKINEVLSPADEVEGLKSHLSVKEAIHDIQNNTYSRLLVFGVSRDDIKGYVMRKDILQAHIDGVDCKISDLSKTILTLPSDTEGRELFNRLLSMKAHIAAVIDENGSFCGIVTLEDLIENIMGFNIYDEFD